MFRTRECFGIELPLRALFDAPTIVEFAQVIESGRTECFAINNISEFLEGVETLSEYEARQELGPSDDE